jgi:hypothetical protein
MELLVSILIPAYNAHEWIAETIGRACSNVGTKGDRQFPAEKADRSAQKLIRHSGQVSRKQKQSTLPEN